MSRVDLLRLREAVKKSGLPQALAKLSLIRKDLGHARLAVPAFFHSFRPAFPALVSTALFLTGSLLTDVLPAQSSGLGRPASEEEIKAWAISVAPDGTGLPSGGGTAVEGQEIYKLRCEECHGPEAKGAEQAALVGGHETLATAKPRKTATGYWPYATTLWDYTNRSMPFDTPGVLTHDQVYAVVAYILSLDGIIGENDLMNAETLPKVEMPNRDGFVPDQRPDTGKPASERSGK